MSRQDDESKTKDKIKDDIITIIMKMDTLENLMKAYNYINLIFNNNTNAHSAQNLVKKETEVAIPESKAQSAPVLHNSRDKRILNPGRRKNSAPNTGPATPIKTDEKDVKGGSKKKSVKKRNVNHKNNRNTPPHMRANIRNQKVKKSN
jgi:hypothetical protein